jgi:cyclic pyranopterin phosphate synthase
MSELSHIDARNRPAMVDVSEKTASAREASARATVRLPAAVRDAIEGDEIQSRKGPVFATAIIAGVMAAKRTHELIPFCHPLGLEKCTIDIRAAGDEVLIVCTCRVFHKTGVEMEALTGASIAALTIYDMCKALSHDIVIADIRLLSKTGGKSDFTGDAVAE